MASYWFKKAIGFLVFLVGPALIAGGLDQVLVTVQVKAYPSGESAVPSSLQQPELEQAFARICPSCTLVPGRAAAFKVVVEDPGLHWKISVFDASGHLLESREWQRSLEHGLSKAADRILGESQGARRDAPGRPDSLGA